MVSTRICTRIDLQHKPHAKFSDFVDATLIHTECQKIGCFANVPVLSLVVVHQGSDDVRVGGDKCVERVGVSCSRYGDLINYVADGCAVSGLLLLCAGVALLGIVAIGVGG